MSKKAQTLDGERTRVEELNLGAEASDPASAGLKAKLGRWYKNLNLVMAGMYTGLNCYGTPNTHHQYEDEEMPGNLGEKEKLEEEEQAKPDRRPI